MFDEINAAMEYMWKRHWEGMMTCNYMMVQLGNRIEVVPDNGVHDIKYMCSTRDYANASY